MSVQLLVTYGTLMRPFGRHETLGISNALSFVSPAEFEGVLFDLGSYPGATPGKGTVHGEVFRLRRSQVLNVVDRYEGYAPRDEASSLFVRRTVSLVEPEGRTAWVYWYNGDVEEHQRIPSGNWRTYTGRLDSD